jgi:hypothetical protein
VLSRDPPRGRGFSAGPLPARYHVFEWEEPFVGQDAIHDELLRQTALYSDARFEIVNIASVGQTVLLERIDSVTMNDKRAGYSRGLADYHNTSKLCCSRLGPNL